MKRVEFVLRVVAEIPDDVPEDGLFIEPVELMLLPADENTDLPPNKVRWVSESSRRLKEPGTPVIAAYADPGW